MVDFQNSPMFDKNVSNSTFLQCSPQHNLLALYVWYIVTSRAIKNH